MDAQSLTVPLWGAIATAGGIISTMVLLVAWVFSTFARKEDLKSLSEKFNKVASDVSYIRGRMEPK